jgi:hypothetical protein
VLSTPPAFVLSQDQTLRRVVRTRPDIDPSGSISFVRFRVTRTRPRPRRSASGIFMTGVHWLLAHCSVLKVRAPPRSPSRLRSLCNKKPPAPSRGRRRSSVPDSTDRLRQARLLACSVVRKRTPMQNPFLGGSQEQCYGTPSLRRPSTHRTHRKTAGQRVTSFTLRS